jgi:pentose-5-phosphate-3-epimerase
MITPIIMELEQDVVADKLAKLHEKKMNQVHIDLGDGLLSDLITIAPS